MHLEGLIGWAAGIIDGEGCIKISHTSGVGYGVYLACQMTHKPTLERLKLILKCGGFYFSESKRTNHKDLWVFSVGGPMAVQAIKVIQPYLLTKQTQAALAIEFHESCSHVRGKKVSVELLALRQVLYEEMAQLNKKGKP